ncbi:MAG: hypothetical protein DRI69_01095 [Bacteroidetes bacterium]|nr:MAG: hypothetical protein DRI69_01095 [Bacteroidota bacterium]
MKGRSQNHVRGTSSQWDPSDWRIAKIEAKNHTLLGLLPRKRGQMHFDFYILPFAVYDFPNLGG